MADSYDQDPACGLEGQRPTYGFLQTRTWTADVDLGTVQHTRPTTGARAGETSQSVSQLPRKHGDLSVGLQHNVKSGHSGTNL